MAAAHQVTITKLVGLEYGAVVGIPPIGTKARIVRTKQVVKECPEGKTPLQFNPKDLGYENFDFDNCGRKLIIFMPNDTFK